MSNIFKSKKLKTICLASLLGFSCLGLVISTICWFTANRRVDGSNSVTITSPEDFSIDYKIYEFDDINKKGIESKITVNNEEQYNFELNPFDTYIPERNNYLSKIIEAKLTLFKPYPYASYLYLDIPCTIDGYLDGSNKVNAIISNVIEFKTALVNYTIDDVTTDNIVFGDVNEYRESGYVDDFDKTYQEGRKFFADPTNSDKYDYGRFVDFEVVNDVVQPIGDDDKVDTVKMQDPTLLPAGVKEATFLIQFDYCAPLANYFYENCNEKVIINNQSGVSGQEILLYTDLRSINFMLAQ